MIKLFTVGLVFCTAAVQAVDITGEGRKDDGVNMKKSQRIGPPVLTEDTWDIEFKKTPEKNRPILVKFDTRKCPKCAQLQKTWKDIFMANSNSVYMANVDCSSDGGRPICEKLNIKEFPTFMAFVGGNNQKYYTCNLDCAKDRHSLIKWAEGGYKSQPMKNVKDEKPPVNSFTAPPPAERGRGQQN